MFSRRFTIITIAAVGVALLASCGDDSEALSKSDLIVQADAICSAADEDLEPVFERLFTNPDAVDFDNPETEDAALASFAESMDEIFPIWQGQVSDLRELTPPAEDRELIKDILDDLEAVFDDMEELVSDASADEPGARDALRESLDGDPFADVNRRTRDYGLLVCGQDE